LIAVVLAQPAGSGQPDLAELHGLPGLAGPFEGDIQNIAALQSRIPREGKNSPRLNGGLRGSRWVGWNGRSVRSQNCTDERAQYPPSDPPFAPKY
jgi:hypothetical protein